MAKRTRVGGVYFIEGAGLVKIGMAVNFDRRFRDLQTMGPVPLRIVKTIDGDYAVERTMHLVFADYRKHGECSNSRPSAWEGDDTPSRTVPNGPASSREVASSSGSEGSDLALTVPHRPEPERQEVRQVGPHVLAFYDGLCDPDELAAWDAFVAQRGGR